MKQLLFTFLATDRNGRRHHFVAERDLSSGIVVVSINGRVQLIMDPRKHFDVCEDWLYEGPFLYTNAKLEYHNDEFKIEYNIQYLNNKRVAFTQFKKEGNVISSMNCVNQSNEFLLKLVEVDLNGTV